MNNPKSIIGLLNGTPWIVLNQHNSSIIKEDDKTILHIKIHYYGSSSYQGTSATIGYMYTDIAQNTQIFENKIQFFTEQNNVLIPITQEESFDFNCDMLHQFGYIKMNKNNIISITCRDIHRLNDGIKHPIELASIRMYVDSDFFN